MSSSTTIFSGPDSETQAQTISFKFELPLPPPQACSNCGLNISGKENEDRFTEFALVDPDELEKEDVAGSSKYVNVSQAIGKVFGALIKLNNVQMPDSSVLVMCHQCITSLGELYRFYIGFLESTSNSSIIHGLLTPIPQTDGASDADHDRPLKKDVGVWVNLYSPRTAEALLNVKRDQDEIYDNDDYGEGDRDEEMEYIVPEMKPATSIITRSMTKNTKPSSKKRALDKQKSNSYKFKCSKTQCLKRFVDEASFQDHLISHNNSNNYPSQGQGGTETIFKCDDCGKEFRSGKLYRRHRKFKHGEGLEHLTVEEINARKCDQCSRIFGIPSQLVNHIKNVHAKDKPFGCKLCDKKFPSQNYLRIHLRIKHKDTLDRKSNNNLKNSPSTTRLQPCVFCEEVFNKLTDLKSHFQNKHPGEKFVCTYEGCNKAFRCIRLFRRHKKIKHGEGLSEEARQQLTCGLCDKVFGIPSQLKQHLDSVHATEKNIACELCPAMFPTINRLKIHKVTKHKDPTKAILQTYNCDKCEKTYNSASGFQYHVDTVHLQKTTYSFVCEHCGKKFARSDWLKAHQLIHEPNRPKPFQCTECFQLFLTRKNLIAHRKVHSGKKDLLCSICGKEFLHSQSLKRHIQARHAADLPDNGTMNVSGTIVAQPQPHSCLQCGKTFKFREYLLQHLRSKTHGGKGHTAQRKREQRLKPDSSIPSTSTITIDIDQTEEIKLVPVVPQPIQVIEAKNSDDPESTPSYFVQLLIQ